jgi:4'-phosphopantetheinyl transferase
MRSLFTSVSIVPGELSRDEILVIAGDLASLEGIPLSHAESRRAQSMTSVEARLRFTAARRILRSVISSWIGVSPLDLEIVPDENGKPRLEPAEDVHFSISHTSDCIAVAFSRSAVGLDLERMRPVDAKALASRFFSPEEALAVRESGEIDLFFKLWTCREAAIKADGRGLSNLMDSTRVLMGKDAEDAGVEILIGSNRWQGTHWKMDEHCHGALAFREKPSQISWCDIR